MINEKIAPGGGGVILGTKESMDVLYGNSVLQEWFPSLFGRREKKSFPYTKCQMLSVWEKGGKNVT